jgi:ribosomal-protein-serine acetyltransferase
MAGAYGGHMRTELSDGLIDIRAYQPGIELAVLEAARESLAAISPYMRTWRDGATYAKAARHVSESVRAWQAGTWYDLAIDRGDSNTFLGRVGLDRIAREQRTANVGYWVRTGCTRQGIATAAVRLVAQFAFEDLDLKQLEFVIARDNVASRRVAEKAGAIAHPPAVAGATIHGHDDDWYLVLIAPPGQRLTPAHLKRRSR